MTTAEPTTGTIHGTQDDRKLMGSLAGREADRERAVGHRTRRVVLASMGVLADNRADQRRMRSVALAAILLIVLLLGPLVWLTVDSIVAGGRLTDLTNELGVWIMFLGAALLASVLLAGWLRKKP